MANQQSRRREAAARLLGLPGPDRLEAPVRLAEATPLDHPGWVFRLEGTAIPTSEILVKPRDDASPFLIVTAHLGLSIRGQELHPVVRSLLERVARRLQPVTFERFHWWIEERLEAANREGSGPAPDDDLVDDLGGTPGKPVPACPGLNVSWNHPRAWSRFFADEELQPGRDGVIQFRMPFVRLEHGDIECQYVWPRGFTVRAWEMPDSGLPRCLSWRRTRPLERHALPPEPPFPGGPAEPAEVPPEAVAHRTPEGDPRGATRRMLFTNLLDLDVIQGSIPALESALETVRREIGPEGLLVNCTCVPQLIGDDVLHSVEQARKAAPYPILYKDQSTGVSPFDRNLAMMREALQSGAPVDRDPLALNLVGFRRGRDRTELVAWTEALGVRINRTVLPEIETDWADGYLRADAQVLYPFADWEPFYARIFEGLDLRAIRAPAPYGIQGTRGFLDAVANGMALPPEASARVEQRVAAFLERHWAPRVRQASTHRVGILCEQSRLPRLEGFGVLWGFPLPALLREMGFQVSLAIVEEPRCGRDLAADTARWRDLGVRVSVLESEAQCADWLADPSIRAVFSDYFFDDRLVHTGHAPFSLKLFERGFEGAVRSLDRLLDRCEVGAFARP